MRDPEPTSRKRKAPPAPRPKRRRKTKAAPVEPVLSEYELGRRAKIKRNNKFLVSVGLLFPPKARTQRLHCIATRQLKNFRRRSRTTSTPGGT